jgi:hypothetical protein
MLFERLDDSDLCGRFVGQETHLCVFGILVQEVPDTLSILDATLQVANIVGSVLRGVVNSRKRREKI